MIKIRKTNPFPTVPWKEHLRPTVGLLPGRPQLWASSWASNPPASQEPRDLGPCVVSAAAAAVIKKRNTLVHSAPSFFETFPNCSALEFNTPCSPGGGEDRVHIRVALTSKKWGLIVSASPQQLTVHTQEEATEAQRARLELQVAQA